MILMYVWFYFGPTIGGADVKAIMTIGLLTPFTSSDSSKLKILEFPKQRDEIINARIEIDLSEGTKIIPLRDLLFLDLRVKGFFILIFIYNSFVMLKEL